MGSFITRKNSLYFLPSVLRLLPQASLTSCLETVRNLLCTAYSPLQLLYKADRVLEKGSGGSGGREVGEPWEDFRFGPQVELQTFGGPKEQQSRSLATANVVLKSRQFFKS